MTLLTLTHAQICVSPLNVRKNKEDANATDAMEASIENSGLLYPLIVHPMAMIAHLPEDQRLVVAGDPAAEYGALAGGRRWRAIRNLIASGRLPADWPIDCIVREVDPARITEISLIENLIRRDLRPYEVHAAIAKAHEEGSSAEDIASRFGQRVEWIRQQLRLGQLAPAIFEAYVEGRLSIEHAQAYGATEDRDLQMAAFNHLGARAAYDHTPKAIRAFLGVGDREAEKLLRLVGHDAYLNAGGNFERDLFYDGPEGRGRITDPTLLRKLSEDKLQNWREALRRVSNLPDLRFSPQPPQIHGTTDETLEIVGVFQDRENACVLPAGDIFATLTIEQDGEITPRFWWASRKARRDADGPAATGPAEDPAAVEASPPPPAAAIDDQSYAKTAIAAVKDDFGLSADGLQVVRSMRRELLRALLVDDAAQNGAIGRDYAVWSQLRQELGNATSVETGARSFSAAHHPGDDEAPRGLVEPHLETMEAHAVWLRALDRVRAMPAFSIEDLADAFEAFAGAEEAEKRLAGAVLAGLALVRSANAQGWRIKAHDRLADLTLGSDRQLRSYWTPTTEFAGMFAKLKRLELAQPFVDPAGFKTWHKFDDRVITTSVVMALQGERDSSFTYRVAAADWIHPLLSFGVPASAERRSIGAEVDLDLSGVAFSGMAHSE